MGDDAEKVVVHWVHNPGSDGALAQGCLCARMDNNRGLWPPLPPDGWYVTVGCPVHYPQSPEEIA